MISSAVGVGGFSGFGYYFGIFTDAFGEVAAGVVLAGLATTTGGGVGVGISFTMTVSTDGAGTSLTVSTGASAGASTVPSGHTGFDTTGAGLGLAITFAGTDDSGTVPSGQVGSGLTIGTHFKGAGDDSEAPELTTVETFLNLVTVPFSLTIGKVVLATVSLATITGAVAAVSLTTTTGVEAAVSLTTTTGAGSVVTLTGAETVSFAGTTIYFVTTTFF